MDLFGTVFVFLFKYRPVVFERGELAFGNGSWLLLLVGVAALCLTLFMYWRTPGKIGALQKTLLVGLRLGALAVVLFCLARPVLMIATVVPQQNFLGILVDDSRSMQIADVDGVPRSTFVDQTFGPEGSPLLADLADRFKLRFFRFSKDVERLHDMSALSYTGSRTDLGGALERARQELSGVPLAGLVLVSDGAHNADNVLTESLLRLRAEGVPVHAVGLGREEFEKDIEIRRVETPRAVLLGSSVAVDVMVAHRGFRGQTIQVNVEDAGRIVSSEDVRLPRDGELTTVRLHFTVSEAGPRRFRFVVPPRPDELVSENNAREALVHVENSRAKILYFEGEPRFEVKFLRRAVAGDDNIQLVTLQRTAEDKYLRLEVDDEDELAGFFPKTREELFQYRGLILGSVEASSFSHDQLDMIEEFVSQRGGGLLMLGGRLSFAEGGYGGTPVADALPVVLPPEGAPPEPIFAEVKVQLTPFGRSHPATRLAGTIDESAERWLTLPALSMLNPIRTVKPGASTLLTGVPEDGSDPYVVLAYQRYGRGKALVLPVQDSWIWQMHADIPLEDETHETLWRQLLRWLVSYVPPQVTASTASDQVAPGESVTITTLVSDSSFMAMNDVQVTAYATTPSGAVRELPMEWNVERDGEYRAALIPDEEGLYDIRVEARQGGVELGSDRTYVDATQLATEYFDAEMHASLLRRIADETGGHFYTGETADALAEDVSFTESGTTVYEEKDLWDMPALFLLLLALVAGEWSIRRWRGLA